MDDSRASDAPEACADDDVRFGTLLDRWFAVQRVVVPMLKRSLESFQGEEHALMLLAERRDGMSPTELMHEMGITLGRTSNLLRQLEHKGLFRFSCV